MKIAGVRFRDNWRVYDFDATDVDVAVGDSVIVESDRGLGFARVVRIREGEFFPEAPLPGLEQKGQAVKKEGARTSEDLEEEVEVEIETPASLAAAAGQEKQKPPKGHRKVVRRATDDDLRRDEKNREREAEAFKLCQEMVAGRELPMRLIRAEYAFDSSRVTFYFFSETRVDFRELVRDLACKLKTRIEMRQVGVRDVARMIGGFGPCGRELCCTSHLRSFEPVSIRMAKKQEMVLNPAKISGVCGRLLCCLSYEYEMYDDIKKDITEMKEAAAKEKKEEQERRQAEEKREAEERRQAEEQRRFEEERRKKEQRQRELKRQQEQNGQKQDKQNEGTIERQRPENQVSEQRREERQMKPVEQEQPHKPGEKRTGGKKRRFWRKKKKKDGGSGPQQSGPAGA